MARAPCAGAHSRRGGSRSFGRVDAPLIAAGVLGLVGTAVHGVGGQRWVLSELPAETLPASRLGGPRMTRAMIVASWHMATVGFLTTAVALLLAGSVVDGDAARGIALVAAAAATGFAAIALAAARSPRGLLRHPAAVLLTAMAALAWWGTL